MSTNSLACDVMLKLQVGGDDQVSLGMVGAVAYGREVLEAGVQAAGGVVADDVLGRPFVLIGVNDDQLEQLTAALLDERARARHARAMTNKAFFHREWYPAHRLARRVASALQSMQHTSMVRHVARNDEALIFYDGGRWWRVVVMPEPGTDGTLTTTQAAPETTQVVHAYGTDDEGSHQMSDDTLSMTQIRALLDSRLSAHRLALERVREQANDATRDYSGRAAAMVQAANLDARRRECELLMAELAALYTAPAIDMPRSLRLATLLREAVAVHADDDTIILVSRERPTPLATVTVSSRRFGRLIGGPAELLEPADVAWLLEQAMSRDQWLGRAD